MRPDGVAAAGELQAGGGRCERPEGRGCRCDVIRGQASRCELLGQFGKKQVWDRRGGRSSGSEVVLETKCVDVVSGVVRGLSEDAEEGGDGEGDVFTECFRVSRGSAVDCGSCNVGECEERVGWCEHGWVLVQVFGQCEVFRNLDWSWRLPAFLLLSCRNPVLVLEPEEKVAAGDVGTHRLSLIHI